MRDIPDELLQEIVRRLVAEFDPEQIILFGSHAWGTPDEDSDVDLMVIVSESNERPIQRDTRAHMALLGLRVPKDILVKTRQEFDRYAVVHASLEAKVNEEGRILHG